MTNKIITTIILTLAVMGIAVYGVNAQVTATESPRNIMPTKAKQLDITCVKTAVEQRENAVLSAWDKFFISFKSESQTRTTEILAAWDITDKVQRGNAIDAAWMKFRKSRIVARKKLNEERQAAWKKFKVDRKLCGSGPTGEDQNIDISI